MLFVSQLLWTDVTENGARSLNKKTSCYSEKERNTETRDKRETDEPVCAKPSREKAAWRKESSARKYRILSSSRESGFLGLISVRTRVRKLVGVVPVCVVRASLVIGDDEHRVQDVVDDDPEQRA